MAQVYFEDVSEGTRLPTLVKTPTTHQLVMFACATYDYYELHYDRQYALESGVDDVIVHGPLKNSFLAQLVTDWMGEAGTLKKLSVQYRGMDMPGSPVYAEGTVTRKYVHSGVNLVDCDLRLVNAAGETTTPGSAVVALPSRR